MGTIYVVKSSKEAKFVRLHALIETTGLFFYILEFFQGLAIDLIYANSAFKFCGTKDLNCTFVVLVHS